MGPASVSSACLLLTVAKKSIIAAGFLGTPKSGHAVKLNWYTSRDPSPCETQQHVNFAKFNNKKKPRNQQNHTYLYLYIQFNGIQDVLIYIKFLLHFGQEQII